MSPAPGQKLLGGLLVVVRIMALVVWSCVVGRFVEVVDDPPAREATPSHRHGSPRPP
jgi:hypothetical protein